MWPLLLERIWVGAGAQNRITSGNSSIEEPNATLSHHLSLTSQHFQNLIINLPRHQKKNCLQVERDVVNHTQTLGVLFLSFQVNANICLIFSSILLHIYTSQKGNNAFSGITS